MILVIPIWIVFLIIHMLWFIRQKPFVRTIEFYLPKTRIQVLVQRW